MIQPQPALATSLSLLALLASSNALSQEGELFESETELLEALGEEKADADGSKNELVAAPVPIINPTFGNGLALLGIYLYDLDEGSQPSFTAVAGAYTDSNSWAFGIGQAAHFKGDAWKIKGGAAVFDVNVDYYGTGRILGDLGIGIPLNQDGWAAGARVLRRITGNWYFGLQYWFVKLKSSLDPSEIEFDLPQRFELDSQVAGIGLMVEYDSRDNRFNPKRGQLLNGTWNDSSEAIGSDFEYRSSKVNYNIYRPIAAEMVIAGRATLCATPGDAPFYALCKFGQGVDLRGYVGGRFRDETMATLQAEYRWLFYKKLGMVAFAGVGEVGEQWSDYNLDDLLGSAGLGLRYRLSDKTGFNISVDYAVGKDSDAWYFYVGESF